MDNLCKHLMLGGSTAALLAVASASVVYAQENQTAPETETLTVSSSRINIQGYEAPTPVTVISAASLQRDAKTDIGDAIRELPSVGISDSPGNGSHAGNASQGDAGIDTINLRGLGVVRTLVLFDGQRVATSNPNASAPPAIGGVDLSTIPTTIIERIDVVTGGASAAWGSDAVAGVVNLVINKHFTGLKGNIVYGNDSYGDHESFKGELTWGMDLLGGRLHTEAAGTYTMSPNTMFNWSRPWYSSDNRSLYPCALVGNTSSATLCHTPSGVYSTSFTNGGLITNSAAGSSANVTAINLLGQGYTGVGSTLAAGGVLKGNQFVGATGVVPFNYGTSSGANCYNCSAGPFTDITNGPLTAVPYHNVTLFSYTSYKLTDDITASVMLNYGYNAEQNQANNGRQSQQTINIDNPFIPASIRQEMIAGGIPSFSLGTAANENMTAADVVGAASLNKAYAKAIGENYIQNYRQLMRGVFTLAGDYKLIDQDWSWNAYAQHTMVREWQYAPYNTIGANFGNAVDAVTVTATGRDSLGADPITGAPIVIGPTTPGWDPTLNSGLGGFQLANGTVLGANALLSTAVTSNLQFYGAHVPQVGDIACRSALTATTWGVYNNPVTGFSTVKNGNGTTNHFTGGYGGGLMAGCVPLNLFGDGNTSQAALNYIAPGRTNKAVEDQALYRIGQSVFSVSTQGTLPWGLPAGKVAVALGFEDRLEQQRVQRDPLQLGQSGAWESGNFAQYAGQYSVEEGFLELDVPVLKDDIVQSLDFNAAGRLTSYSTSGLVETWKLGLTSQVNDDLRLRTTLSSDIRAPGIGELFQSPLISTQTITYPPSGPDQHTYNVHYGAAGNQGLVPEQALTISGGVVLTPHWIENLSLSLDWYSITLHQGIFAPSNGQIFDQCANHGAQNFCALVFKGVGYTNSNTPVASEVDLNGNSPGLSSIYGTFTADSEGAINFYLQSPVNANRETVSGLDFQADYRHVLWDGSVDWHLVGNYTDEKTRTSLGITVDGAGAVSGDSAVNPLTGFTEPKLRFTMSSTYAEGPFSLTAQARLIGSARLSNTYIEGVNVDDNSVPAVLYGDFRGSYRFSDTIQFYAAVDNLFNAPPPNIATATGGGTDCRIYDCIGRSYRIGVRFDD